MRSDELPTMMAIYRVERLIEERRAAGEQIPPFGSDDWLIEPERRREMLSMIQSFLLPDEALLRSYTRYRKSGDKKLRLLVEVATRHGDRCFFRDRGKGECSGDIDLDRIIPGARGGDYTIENCQLACSRHNRERGDRSVEEYLASSRVAAVAPPAGA